MRKKLIAILVLMLALVLPAKAIFAAESAETRQPGLLDIDWGSVIWVIGLFLVVFFIIYKAAWKNVLAGLNARESRIRKAIADADDARAKGEAALVEYNKQLTSAQAQVRELLSTATLEAEKIAAGIKMHAQQEAEEIKERAMKEIESGKQQALNEIYEQTASLATSVAEKILRRNLNADDQRDLVQRSLEELQAVHV
jgi:F-type H+-transporting ATPase subunit b